MQETIVYKAPLHPNFAGSDVSVASRHSKRQCNGGQQLTKSWSFKTNVNGAQFRFAWSVINPSCGEASADASCLNLRRVLESTLRSAGTVLGLMITTDWVTTTTRGRVPCKDSVVRPSYILVQRIQLTATRDFHLPAHVLIVQTLSYRLVIFNGSSRVKVVERVSPLGR